MPPQNSEQVSVTRERVVERERVVTDSSGWVFACFLLIVAIIAGVWAYFHYYRRAQPQPSGDTNINVTLPGGTTDTSGSENPSGAQ